ncbi:3-methyl-2-oxobutanoate hydroxymethyltransferase [Neoehrlichia mikurensis]|uniref:3-methyl-2-oxobutanoate hydroxymethyltransferase n=1 Tax=Neoehrlichia mikurensis TaxID=89586 RepID=A0A9Q9F5D8_9RICK|nr:3-methyl-2-oxobutanoate hydroxymethyltransferase [Neoehrlichia mikurensis]UTO55656.1 3-methyl-2-oxobutanoate hydroxymethyltransferase [Neoehrlichia mikurensis]UTO56577.1 3-methyl-2-oxobutanoate hydroxymethyltransferase [Neoehrlichia mikurensis]
MVFRGLVIVRQKVNIIDIQNKKGREKIVCLAVHTFSIASLADQYCDLLLVGDSVGMVVYGMESTLEVTIDMMINHGKAVVKARKKSFVVVDMPFASYFTKEIAYENAAKILSQTGCDAVKMEGGYEIANIVSFLTRNGIPVMGHVGLMPQHFKKLGGYKCQGNTDLSYASIVKDAEEIYNAGAFAVVLECINESLAVKITNDIPVPTIGIGASLSCDGQILVIDDMLGLSKYCPKFVKKFANINEVIEEAVSSYAQEVKDKKFPSDIYCYKL